MRVDDLQFDAKRVEARIAEGKARRKTTPRRGHAAWQRAQDRPDPLELLLAQDASRLGFLVPIKYGRMSASPFAFLRGSAVVMASDLAGTPNAGMDVVLCGDAHLSNFGVFGSPERDLVFDLNDFDEAYPGPWEWDLKRLAASAVVAGREHGFKRKITRKLVRAAVVSYRQALQHFSGLSTLDTWYFHVEASQVQALFKKYASGKSIAGANKMITKARARTQARTLEKMTNVRSGRRQFNSQPPLLIPARQWPDLDLVSAKTRARISEKQVTDMWVDYLKSLPEERRYLLSRYKVVDIALRVGGVGSVGTRCFAVLLQGGDQQDALILQVKEATPSVLAPYLAGRTFQQQAARVVTGQRLMQTESDIFLGYQTDRLSGNDYYWRQLKDMKGSVDLRRLDAKGLGTYLVACGYCLARAHARTGDAAVMWGYVGAGHHLDNALADFAEVYADQTERDHAALVAAIESGRIAAESGV